MAAFDDAIEAAGRTMQATVTITWPGGTNPIFETVCDVSINQALADLPESVTQVAGVASASATVVLKAASGSNSALDLSPFSTNSWSTRTVTDYGLGAVIVIAEKVLVSGSFTSTTLFTGTIIGYQLNDDGSAELQCQDKAAAIQSVVSLPAAGGKVIGSSDTRINPIAVVDLALRSAGLCISPSTRTNCVLSVPGVGSPLPEVGEFISNTGHDAYRATPWSGSVAQVNVSTGGVFSATSLAATTSEGWFAVEGWFRPSSWPAVSQVLVAVASDATQSKITLTLNNNGSVTATYNTASSTSTAAAAFANDNAFHYVALHWQAGAAATANIRVDSTSSSGFTLTAPAMTTRQVTASTPFLGLQVWRAASASAITSAYNNSWTPTVTASINSVTTSRLTGVHRQTVPAWQTIQEVAAAYGSIAYFNGAGSFVWESRDTWKARRIGTPERTLTGDRILAGAPGWNMDGLRRTVQANIVAPAMKQSTTTLPGWTAAEVYTVAARSTTTIDVTLPEGVSIYDIPSFTNAFQSGTGNCYVRAVAATAEDDIAAVHIVPIGGMTAAGVAGGLRLTVINNNAVDLALWTPGDGGANAAGPYVIVHGKVIRNPDPKLVSVDTGAPTWTADLVLPDNVWRQESTQARAYIGEIAQELSTPQIIWPSIEIPADPRLALGDVVSIQDTRYMDVAHPVQIVGITWNLPADGMHTMSLAVRGAYPPTGWVLGVAGRSEVSSTTVVA